MSFTTIDHEIRIRFNLTLNEYAICDSIYYLSREGLCSASKKYLGDFIGISKQSVHTILNSLESKKLIIRFMNGVKTTELWNNEILKIHTFNSKESLPTSKESLPTSKESLPTTVKNLYPDSKESLHNKDIISTVNNNNNKNRKTSSLPSLEEWIEYCKSMGYTFDFGNAWAFYESNGWRQKGGNKIIDWRRCATTCQGFEKKFGKPNTDPEAAKQDKLKKYLSEMADK